MWWSNITVWAWAIGTAAIAVSSGTAFAADPKVPPAVESGNRVPIAILTAGFDYTRPEIAARLARDGEGEIIAWDVMGEDRFPFDPAGDTELMTALAAQLPEAARVSLLAVKVDVGDPVSLAKGLAFVARTPAQTVMVPMWSDNRAAWEVFAQAAGHFSQLRLIVRTCPDLPAESGAAVYPRDLKLAPSDGVAAADADDPARPLFAYVETLACRRP
jgi:hypothetical protein